MFKAQTLYLALVALMLTHFAAGILLEIHTRHRRHDNSLFTNGISGGLWFGGFHNHWDNRPIYRNDIKRRGSNDSNNDAVSRRFSRRNRYNSDRSHGASREMRFNKKSARKSYMSISDSISRNNNSLSDKRRRRYCISGSKQERQIANLKRTIMVYTKIIIKLHCLMSKLIKSVDQLKQNDKDNKNRVQIVNKQLRGAKLSVDRLEHEVSNKNTQIKQLESELKTRENFWKEENKKQRPVFKKQIRKLPIKPRGRDHHNHKKTAKIRIVNARD